MQKNLRFSKKKLHFLKIFLIRLNKELTGLLHKIEGYY